MLTIYDFKAVANNQSEFDFAQLQGKTLLIVNTASKCGFTPQYDDLEKLYQQYKDSGLVVIGFPCDQFAHQEPGSDADIAEYCRVNHGVTFPLMSKIDVNGKNTHPVFAWLKEQASGKLGSSIKWNFTKFLVEKDGLTVHRYAPTESPLALIPKLQEVL
ncbi:glutathione peroxidase [Sphaerochaeta sp.]|uniref:glutathione peroxidase n=1 Tax=Sphaerochaeta sp. TaxID=1972642 RepID=UPI001794A4DA|nr:glutathione peroxidase [Sphaerochaeta sp.]MDD3456056.1 glutathione peroxidase [Sphaerochaeta sp.]NLA97427.1 glutathione peroxidase [Spirochaetales bacterium]